MTKLTKTHTNLFFITSFILGIIWHNWHPKLFMLIIPLGIFMLFFVTLAVTAKSYLRTILLCSLAFFAGNYNLRSQINTHTQFLHDTHNKQFDMVASATNITKLTHKRSSFCICVSTNYIREKGSHYWSSQKKQISFYLKEKPFIKRGDTILIKKIILKKPNNKNFIRYMTKEGIAASIFTNKLDYKLLYRPQYSLNRWIQEKKYRLINDLQQKMSAKLFSAFSSMFLGNNHTAKIHKENLKHKFRAWGILHILARSGLHLVIFLFICQLLLTCIPIHLYYKQIITLLLSIIYLLLSWPSVSFIRAFSVLILYKICPFLQKKADMIYIVSIIGVAMLIINPMQLFFLDFQLSFLLTLTLAIHNKVVTQKKRSPNNTNKSL